MYAVKTSFFKKNYHQISWRDSISRPITPASSVAGGDDTTRPRRPPGQSAVYVNFTQKSQLIKNKYFFHLSKTLELTYYNASAVVSNAVIVGLALSLAAVLTLVTFIAGVGPVHREPDGRLQRVPAGQRAAKSKAEIDAARCLFAPRNDLFV
jgi:hypothetical protein